MKKLKNNLKLKTTYLYLVHSIFSKILALDLSLKLSLFNKNIYNDDVVGLENDLNVKNNITIASDNRWPLVKFNKNSYQSITPRVFLKYTTGKMQNATNQDKILNFSDIFSMNRTNSTDAVETGGSAGYGFEYINNKNKSNSIKNFYSSKFSFGQVIRKNQEELYQINHH